MTTATTTTLYGNDTTAHFQAWVAEVIAELIAVGVTQTADTGQINTGTVTPPTVANTSAGYAIFRFNDTLQSTSPVFFRIDFGCGSTAATMPMMWLTVGTGSNGSGTITGTAMPKSAIAVNVAPISTTALYPSRFCYNTTYGICWMGWKYGGNNTAAYGPSLTAGGFVICRSNNSSGAVTGDAVFVLVNTANTASGGASSTSVYAYTISYLTNVVYPGVAGTEFWCFTPYVYNSNPSGGNVQVYPIFYSDPLINISAYVGMALMADIALGGTFNLAIVGSTALPFIQAGMPIGTYLLCNGNNQFAAGSNGLCLIWA